MYTSEEQVVYLKQGMQEIGFYSKDFSCLPNDMTSGSRELLLAFAWLLGTRHVVDKFMENCASPITIDIPEITKVILQESCFMLFQQFDCYIMGDSFEKKVTFQR